MTTLSLDNAVKLFALVLISFLYLIMLIAYISEVTHFLCLISCDITRKIRMKLVVNVDATRKHKFK